MDNNNNNNQIENANQNENENEMKNLEKKVTKNLIEDYSNLLNENSFKDFSIFVENKSNPFEIKVHKSILSSRSPFFNEFLKGQNHLNKIFLNQFNKKEMESILNSISKQDFDKLKQFDFFLPNSFLINFERTIFEIQDEENQTKIKDKEKKIKRRDKRIKSFESKNQKQKQEIEKKDKENQQMKIEIEDKWKKEIEKKKPKIEIEEKWKKEKLQEWINDNDFFSKMKKGFSAKRDGFNSQNWHKAVDGKGKTLVIIKTKQNFIFGGFTQVGFNGNKGGINDSSAFIFSLRNDKGNRIPAKFTIKQNYAIYSNLSYGPTFGSGGHDIWLNSNLQPGYSNFGNSYNLPNGITYGTNEAQSYLAGSYKSWVVDEFESYFI
ncbi:hypothetical protein M0811_03904 [Anaeramoeba ignava]|uniref:BTB domain-containing protein n=1 Tax=Anaeramoeba ignava TaxID=1746090 RepID=A0A9Q0LXL0_ANAIG|nr:hypothetical protein M0811_03904 [Anaeramoeba ignava]